MEKPEKPLNLVKLAHAKEGSEPEIPTDLYDR